MFLADVGLTGKHINRTSERPGVQPDVTIDDPDNVMLKLSPAANEVVYFRVDTNVFLADDEGDIHFRIFTDNPLDIWDRRIQCFRHGEDEFEERVVLLNG